jgi:predicted AAA+ superfamily ATPase
MPFQRAFPFVPKDPGLYVIRGPRQIGKSCWLKTILSKMAPKHRCVYLSCEHLETHQELGEFLKSVRDHGVVLLDEVSFVKDWDRAVKHAVDSGYPRILVVTGSHAHDLKRGADRMPGRFDGGGEFSLLPMSFDEFHQARQDAGWASDDRLAELRAYFRVGGFPTAVAEAGAAGKRPRRAISTYWKWLSGDVVRLGKQEALLQEILIQLALTTQTPTSLQTLAKKTRIGSHNTVQDYLSVLDSCFAVRTLHAVDIDTGAYRFRKDRKFYFSDPLLYWMALDLSGQAPPDDVESRLAEMVAHEHLHRAQRRFGYHSNESGEVDFILPKRWAIEVKWSDAALNLSKTYLKLTIPEKIVWTQRNFLSEMPSNPIDDEGAR